jgi:predicted NUDIX family NTP pyrophosphohydrolase
MPVSARPDLTTDCTDGTDRFQTDVFFSRAIGAIRGCLVFSVSAAPKSFAIVDRLAAAMKQSSGTLLYRKGPAGIEVLLIHASGAYNRKAPWSIPKGEPDEEENLEVAARRETLEETDVKAGSLTPLGFINYTKSRKRVYCFAGPAPADAEPRCASWEIDQVRFVSLEEARSLLHPEQRVFIDRLAEHLRGGIGQ